MLLFHRIEVTLDNFALTSVFLGITFKVILCDYSERPEQGIFRATYLLDCFEGDSLNHCVISVCTSTDDDVLVPRPPADTTKADRPTPPEVLAHVVHASESRCSVGANQRTWELARKGRVLVSAIELAFVRHPACVTLGLVKGPSRGIVVFRCSVWEEVFKVVCESLVDIMFEQDCEEDWGECRQELEGFEFGLKADGL